MPISAPRLPGLRFETARPPADAELPRMDVAAFVGFASTGPVGLPVAVDDEVRFRQVFGPDLPIAWDRERGEAVHAHLAPTVREFFRNGGRRCWIVRVAGQDGLETSSFRVPGMLHARGRCLWAAYLLASSPGSWADGMSLNATLRATLVAGGTERNDGILLGADSPDLLRIEWPEERVVGFFPPNPIRPARDSTFEERQAAKVRLFAHAWFFHALTPYDIKLFARDAVFLAGPEEIPLSTNGLDWSGGGGGAVKIPLAAGEAEALQPGSWVRVILVDGPGEAGVLGHMADPPDKPGKGSMKSGSGDVPSMWSPDAAAPSDAEPSIPVDRPGSFAPSAAGAEKGGGGKGEGGKGQGSGQGSGSGSGSATGAGTGGGSGTGSGEGQGPGSGQGSGTGSGSGQGSGSGTGTGSGHGQGSGQGAGPGQGSGSGTGTGSGQGQGAGQGNQGSGNSGQGDGGTQSEAPATPPRLYGRRAYLLVDEVKYENGRRVAVIRQAWRTMHHDLAWDELRGKRRQAALVNIELWTRRADGSEVRLPEVGLAPGHPRFLGSLPPDEVVFAPTERLTQTSDDALYTELALRRFQLAAPGSAAFAASPTLPPLPASHDGTSGEHDGHGHGQGHHEHGQGHGYGHDHHGHGQESPQGHDYGQHPDDDEGSCEGLEVYLPLGVPVVLRDEFYQGAYHSTRSPLERDGLAAFSADLFLDPWLRNESAETLLKRAFQNAYVFQPPQPPVRMHALLPVDEVSLLAVPDAVHTGWTLNPVELPPDAPPPPYLIFVNARLDEEGRIRVEWSPEAGARGYILQDSPDPRFRYGVRVTETVVGDETPALHTTVIRPQPCPARLYFRVRVRTDRGLSPWSSTALVDLPDDLFNVCGTRPLHAPWVDVSIQGERLAIHWEPAWEGELSPEEKARRAGYTLAYRVESSPEPSFGLPELVYDGAEQDAEVWRPLNGTLFFRAAARLQRDADPGDGAPPHILEESPWSATATHLAQQPKRWETIRDAGFNPQILHALHVAMLRFCAARSDCFAVLALPRHYREPQALAHAQMLTAALGGSQEVGDLGARTLSFGALYHPWTVVRAPGPSPAPSSVQAQAAPKLPAGMELTGEEGEGLKALAPYAAPVLATAGGAAPLRAIPPDGATAGVMATRANQVGAWAAPANQPLGGVAVLDPKLPESVRAAFLGKKVNAVAPFPRGFMTWSEETLSDDPELRGVGVRRLLILLRRLVVREGNTWLFEPSNAAFRRKVQRQWDGLLGMLYVRGAFAGASHAEGYRVVTDDTVNPPQLVEQGRFVVELRVAPSRPLAFLTVRLVQTGAGLTVQEG